MTKPNSKLWPIQPHTVAKHDILRRYLSAWFPIVSSKSSKLVYIDGFCGPGRYAGGENGSPIVALKEALKYSDKLRGHNVIFRFMDDDDERIGHLNLELSGFRVPTNFDIEATPGEFAIQFEDWLDSRDKNGLKSAPTFAFIDPFGFKGLPFDLVQRLLETEKAEVFVNIMADQINRFLAHPDQMIRSHIVELFGTEEVLKIANESENRIGKLIRLYQRQLQKCARFVHYFEMRNSSDRPIYYLFFATNHPLGHLRMKEAFWNIDKTNGFRFSDATNPNQLVLLVGDNTGELSKALVSQFIGQTVEAKTIRDFVENETVFLPKHMRIVLKTLEKNQEVAVSPRKSNGRKRVANSFPDDAIVTFSDNA